MIPWKQNCHHSHDGWCLKCVSDLGDAALELQSRVYYFVGGNDDVGLDDLFESAKNVRKALANDYNS